MNEKRFAPHLCKKWAISYLTLYFTRNYVESEYLRCCGVSLGWKRANSVAHCVRLRY